MTTWQTPESVAGQPPTAEVEALTEAELVDLTDAGVVLLEADQSPQ